MEIVNRETKLDWSKWAWHFGKWADKIKGEGFELLEEPIAKAKQVFRKGRVNCPESENVFRALRETFPEDLKCVMLGIAPYHTEMNGRLVADGLLMGASKQGSWLPPSLSQFYTGLEKELRDGLCLDCVRTNDVGYLAKQGVLMWNMSLITERFKPGSMLDEWEPFMKWWFSEVISVTGVPVIALGKETSKAQKWLAPMQWFFKVSHPAAASHQGTDWDSEGTFTKVNRVIKDMNGYDINWLPTIEEYAELINLPF